MTKMEEVLLELEQHLKSWREIDLEKQDLSKVIEIIFEELTLIVAILQSYRTVINHNAEMLRNVRTVVQKSRKHWWQF